MKCLLIMKQRKVSTQSWLAEVPTPVFLDEVKNLPCKVYHLGNPSSLHPCMTYKQNLTEHIAHTQVCTLVQHTGDMQRAWMKALLLSMSLLPSVSPHCCSHWSGVKSTTTDFTQKCSTLASVCYSIYTAPSPCLAYGVVLKLVLWACFHAVQLKAETKEISTLFPRLLPLILPT